MMKRYALAASLVLVSATPALAAGASVVFIPNVVIQPSYSTANVVQAFSTPQVAGQQVAVNSGAYADTTSSFNPNPSSAAGTTDSKPSGFGSTVVVGNANMVGQFLNVKSGGGYTLNFTDGIYAGGVQYLSFLLDHYIAGTSSVVLKYADNTFSGNIIASLAGLNNTNNHGQVVNNQEGVSSIVGITFSSTSSTFANGLNIDEIAAATPEPAAWLMMILGFGLAGAQLRSRRRAGKLVAA
jgi:hypothetical protein